MKGCAEVRERIPLYVGGDLDPATLEDVGEHLARCGACAREARAALAAREVFRRTLAAGAREALRPSPELWVGVRAALVAEREAAGVSGGAADEIRPRALLHRSRPRRKLLRLAGGLAAAAAVVLMAFLTREAGLVGDDAPAGGTTPAIVVSRPLSLPDGEGGGLRRIAPGDARPLEGAQDVRITNGTRAVPPVPPASDNNALAGERRLRRFR